MRRFFLLALVFIAPMLGSAQGPAVPIARNVVVTTSEGAARNGVLLATDGDGDALTFTIVTPPTRGSLAIDNAATGAFTYTPNAGAIGYDSFVFRAADGGGRASTATGAVFIVTTSPEWPGQTVRASIAPDGSQFTSPSTWGAMSSADGRFVVFSTGTIDETTLTLNANVYVLDRQTGQTTLASKATGSEQPIGGILPWITPDGRYVGFMSLASSLPGGSPSALIDVYVHDRQTGETTRVSVASDGTPGNADSGLPVLSADGRYVAFTSASTNLSPTDINGNDEDVFLRDRQTGQTTLVGVSSAGVQGSSGSWRPVLSADGRFISFNSSASNLVPNDTNGRIDVFVRDLWTGETTRVSVGTGGTQSNGDTQGTISNDGRFVLLFSDASNLVAGDTNGFGDVFVRDLQAGQTTRVSVSSSGAQGNDNAEDGTISADGRFVAFRSWASNLVPGDTNGLPDEFVHDRLTGQTVRINVASDGTLANTATTSTADDDGCCIGAVISADGRSIVFTSLASNLAPGDTNNTDDVFVVGPVSVTPATIAVPAAGGSRSADVAFDFPGTPWTATTTTPWITLTPPIGGSANGTVNFTFAVNTGAARTGTIVAALQTVTVRQDAGNVTALAAANASGTFGGTTTLTATLTAAGVPFAGQQISFALNGTTVGTATTDPSGVATLANASLAGINAGTYLGGVQATYAGDAAHLASTGSATLTIARAVPSLTWPQPASIVVGTPLSGVQLNASANVPGTLAYAPPLGTLLTVGAGQVLSTTFTPTNAVNYTAAQAQVTIDVTAVGAPASATFRLIGDLPGGPFNSTVRDATRVGNTVYAVGASAANTQLLCSAPNVPAGCVPEFNPDTAVLWTLNGSSATLTPLPNLVTPSSPPTNWLFASAITRDGAYLASEARSSSSNPPAKMAVRVTRDGLSNLDLGAPPFPVLNQPASAQAISEDGAILYAFSGIPYRVFRFDVNAPSRALIPLLLPSHTGNLVASRGTSFDGSVMVGTSFVFPFTGTNGRAFRYVHGSPAGTVSPIPLLPGGTWSTALAVSPDGRRTLVAGNSTHLPNGEVYLHDAVTGAITPFGSPNTPWAPGYLAGMSADGSVIVATFVDATRSVNANRHAYIHNAHGWFHLTSALGAQGINLAAPGLQGEGMQVSGISPDGTLVYGFVEHDNDDSDLEGFVAEFPPGYLASFDVPAVPQTDAPIVGVWTESGGASTDVAVFLADGTYFHLDASRPPVSAGEYSAGFERGRYHWDAATGAFTFATLQDTNGSVGLSGGNGAVGLTATVSGDTLDIANGGIVLRRVNGVAGSIVGGWMFGDPRIDHRSGILVLFSNGTFVFAEDGDSVADPSGHDGIEAGTYSWINGVFTATLTLDTNGEWGFGNGPGTGGSLPLQLSRDGLRLVSDGQDAFMRIAHPQAVVPVITSPLTATGIVGSPFAYTITATHGETFNATGLPSGLAVNTATGQISGTLSAAGTFSVTISATNSFGSTGSAQLTISALSPTTFAVANASGTFGGTTTLSATLTSGATPLAGQPVSFTLNGSPVGTATTSGSGVATINNVSLAGINAGTYPTGVQATFAGDATHASSIGTASLTVARAAPILTWPAPATIVNGTPLSSTQLNATANVAGTFVYTPAAGTRLPAGAGQTLSVRFTPADAVNYTTAQAQVTIDVLNAAPVARNVVVTTQEGLTTSATLLATDLENDPVTFSIVTPPTRGTLTLVNPVTGAITYTPTAGATGYDAFTFRATEASGASSTATGSVFIVATSPRWPGQTVRVSSAPNGSQATEPSTLGAMPSADGRLIAFSSGSFDETTGAFAVNVYIHDRQTGQTTLESVAGPGGTPIGGALPWLSPDGRYLAFSSLPGGLPGGHPDATFEGYLRDRQTGQTIRVGVATDGTPANGESGLPVMSADGRYVAFYGTSTNLVPADPINDEDVYLRDLQTGRTMLVSVSTTGVKGNASSWSPTISADGRFIAFNSEASNLVPNDTNGVVDLFVRDVRTGQTTRVSVASGGVQLAAGGGGRTSMISASGRFVLFGSRATNAVPGDTNGVDDVFVRDLQTGTTTRVSVSSSGAQGNSESMDASLSADGRYVAFRSAASNLVPGDTNGLIDEFVHDRATGQTVRINLASDGTQANAFSTGDDDGCCVGPMISGDGRSVVITSLASNLVAGDTNNVDDVFVVGPVSVSPTTVNVPGAGGAHSVNVSVDYPAPWTASTTAPWITINPPGGGSTNGALSFTVAPNLGAARSGTLLVALQTITVNQDASGVPVAQNGTLTTAEDTAASGTLTATDPNGDAITFSLASQAAHGAVVLTNPSTGAFTYTPALNFNGPDSFAFQASAAGETSNIATVSITVTPVNDAPVAVNGTLAALEDATTPGALVATDIDGDALTFSIATVAAHGTVVITNTATGAFTYTPAAEYVGPDSFTFRASDAGLSSNVATVQITVTPVNDTPVASSVAVATQEGVAKNGFLLGTDIDSGVLTFSIVTPPLRGTLTILNAVTGEFTYTPNVGAVGYDTFTFQVSDGIASSTASGSVFIVANTPRWPGQTVRASASSGGAQTNGFSSTAVLSADGRIIAFESSATNLVAGDTNGFQDVFVRDRQTGQTVRASIGAGGAQGNNASRAAAISADGRYLSFDSFASTMVAGDTNNAIDVFVYDRQTSAISRVSVASNGTQGNGSSLQSALSADGRSVAFASGASNLVAGDTNGIQDVFVHDRQTGQTSRVSLGAGGTQPNATSLNPTISPDGRFVAFYSMASNLVPGDTNNAGDVFVHDRSAGQTTRVSVASDGTQANQDDNFGFQPSISADGRYVAFRSFASNLVPGDTNGSHDIFVRDVQTGQTSRVNVSSAGAQANNTASFPSISADGRYVVFRSFASNLVPNDTNNAEDIFVRDRQTALTTRVSMSDTNVQANGGSLMPSISADGRFIAFESDATNLISGDTNGQRDVFVVGGVSVSPTTFTVPGAGGTRSVNVSVEYPGTPWTATTSDSWITIAPPAGGSANGTVSFTVAPNAGAARVGTLLVAAQSVTVNQDAASAPVAVDGTLTTAEDTSASGTLNATDPNGDAITFSIVAQPLRGSVVITDPSTGAFTYTPALNAFGGARFTFQATAGGEASNVATVNITITPVNDAPNALDGTLETLEDTPAAGGLFAGDPDSLIVTFEVLTQPAHGTVTIPNPASTPLGGSFTYVPAANYHGPDSFTFHVIDGAGTSNVATVAINVAPVNDPPVAVNVFFIMQEGVAQSGVLLASNVDGVPLTYELVTSPVKGTLTITNATTGAFTYAPNAGATGYDTFAIRAVNGTVSATATGSIFIAADAPRWPGQTVRASVATGGGQGNGVSSLASLSADGRYVAFYSTASNLIAADTNGFADVFVRDRQTGLTTRVSVGVGGAQANGDSSDQAVSADGRFVAFVSLATNLVSGDTNGVGDVFVHDRQTGQTTRVSVVTGGAPGNAVSLRPDISADGRYVTFDSFATNLVAGDTNARADVFVHDRETGQTRRVSVSTGGAQANGTSLVPSISANGRYVSFGSIASNLVPGDTNGADDSFVHDLQTGQTTRVSVGPGGVQGNNSSVTDAISADGRYVAFISGASNLVPGDTNGQRDVFVHDRQTGQTTRVSVANDGTQGNAHGYRLSINADGRYVAFDSFASNLVPGDTNGRSDVFVHDRQAGQTRRVSVSGTGAQGNHSSDAPVLSADGAFVAFNSDAITLAGADTNAATDIYVVGGASVTPATVAVGEAGGTRSVNVSFAYGGTSWAATTSTPWITLAPPVGGAGNGTATFSIAPNPGAARTGTIVVAMQSVTVTQDAFIDVTRPTVTAPADITVHATVPGGASPATVPALAQFLAGATAVDDVTPSPVQQPPQLGSVVIAPTTVFALGANTVTFSFADASGNIGTAMATVTVLGGQPQLSIRVASITSGGAFQQIVTLNVANTGSGNALNVNVTLSSLRALMGTGTVTLVSGLPASIGLLRPGQAFTAAVRVTLPETVRRFAITEGVTMADYAGAVLSTTATQTIFPIDTFPPAITVGPTTSTIATTSFTIVWQTSEPATSRVDWGVGTSVSRVVPEDTVNKTSHSVTLTGLLPNTTYSFIVSGHDQAGNLYQSIRRTVRTNP